MSTDVTERLTALRPEAHLSQDERKAMLEAILAVDCSTPRPTDRRSTVVVRSQPGRRVLVGAVVTGLAAAVALVAPVLLPPTTYGGAERAAAVELHRLAAVTGDDPLPSLGPGRYWYVEATSTQTGLYADAAHTAPAYTARAHSRRWTDEHGNTWLRDTWLREESTGSPGASRVETAYLPAEAGSPESAAYLANLPTEPAVLRHYLRSHAQGSTSVDEAVVSLIQGITAAGIAPAGLRAAALQVLAETGHVTLTRDARDAVGRSTERFDFIDPVNRPQQVQSIYVDPRTARVVETADQQPGSTTTGVVLQAQLTDAVPGEVLQAAAESARKAAETPGQGG